MNSSRSHWRTGSSSLCRFQAMVTTAGSSSAAAAPFTLRRRGNCFVPPPQRWRPRAAQWRQQQGPRARGMDPQASPPAAEGRGPWKLMPGTTAVRVAGAGVALAMALGGVSWSWTVAARGGSACSVLQPSPPPPLVCVLNDATAAAAGARFFGSYMDSFSKSLRNNKLRGMDPRNTDKLMKKQKKEFNEKKDLDKGVDLTEACILMGNWKDAEDTCQELTRLYPQDPRPRLLSIVINVTQAMEALMSTDPTPTDNDIEEMASKINEMAKNAIDAWKKYRKESGTSTRL